MKKSAFIMAILLCSSHSAQAAFGSCEANEVYSSDLSADWSEADNVVGHNSTSTAPVTGNSYQITCDCPKNTGVNPYYRADSLLPTQGQTTGYYKLNDSLDIRTSLRDIPGKGEQVVPMASVKESVLYQERSDNGLCRDDDPSKRAAAVTIGAQTQFELRITKPFLGELIIPQTDVAVIKAAWSNNVSSPQSPGAYKNLVTLSISGRITIPQNCKINQGDVVQVNLGFINGNRFTTKDAMPDGYTPVTFDITYDCGDTSTIANTLQMRFDADDIINQYILVARRRSGDNVPDVGIRMQHPDGGATNIPFTGGIVFIDSSGSGAAHMSAYPVNLVGGVLAPGKFSGTATITIIVR